MPRLLLRWLPLALLAVAAFWLRTHNLDRRPMHADEANQAVKLGELLDTGRYAFDPRDHHGPTLYFAALPVAWLRGERSLAALTEKTVRLVPALCGTAGVVLLGLLAAPLGRWPALAAAAFLAVSPPAVYYSRYFIQETLLATFTLAAMACVLAWLRAGRYRWVLASDGCAGLMLATKTSALLYGAALVLGFLTHPDLRGRKPPGPGRSLAGLLLALAIAALFYSSFGTNPAGVPDALASLGHGWSRATGESGHEKPWWYYASLFAWHREGGYVWEQIGFALLAAAGLVVAFTRPGRTIRWAAVYTLVVAAALSLVDYKTPWHAIHLVPGMALLAAGALEAVCRLRTGRYVAAALALAVLGMLAKQTRLAVFQRPADQRNPYAYVHSSSDVLKYRPLVEHAIARAPGQPVRVIGDEYWPLPWYLRGLPDVGYWSRPPENCDGALIVAISTQADAVRERLRGRYRESFLGLRPGVIFVVFTLEP